MGTLQRREREKQQRRADIVNTARQIFFEQGLRDTTIDDIARATELARGTIYLYFESKEEIYATVLEQGLDMLDTLIRESQKPDADPMANLLAGHTAFMDFHEHYPEYYNVLMLDKMQVEDMLPETLRERLNAKFVGMAELIADVLSAGIEQGYFRPIPAREAAYLQIGIAMGFAQMLDKCEASQTIFADHTRTREMMHDMIAMSVVKR